MSSLEQQLKSKINSATNIHDIMPILEQLPFDIIQSFTLQHIHNTNSTSVQRLCVNTLSINDILPENVLQHILSFDGFYHTKPICKQWKKHSDQNETNHFKMIYSTINTSDGPWEEDLKYDASISSTWLVR
eukprot:765001_1